MQKCRIYEYLDGYNLFQQTQPPLDVDWTTACRVELHKRVDRTWQGDQLEIGYYAEPEYQTPVVRRLFEIEYRQASVHVVERIQWAIGDGWHDVEKILERQYSGQRWLDWLESKRAQIIKWLRWNVAYAMMVGGLSQAETMTLGPEFFAEHGTKISAYVAGYAQDFPRAVESDSRTWLDLPWPGEQGMTIRKKFIQQLIYTEERS